jgi:hypothetical protein
MKSLVFALFGLMAVGSVPAQIYKVIGPDGKAAYSDRRPADSKSSVSIIEPPAPISPGAGPSILPVITRSSPVKQAPLQPRPTAGVVNRAGDTLRPEVIGAVANVMGIAHLVNSSREFCIATLPASVKRYTASAVGWQQRNALAIAKKNRLMSSAEQALVASALSGDMIRKTDEMMRPVKLASMAEKTRWCDKTFEEVDRGMLDLVGRASIEPLMSYTLK